MAKFNILHVTDLHISSRPHDAAELLKWIAAQFLAPSAARQPVLDAVAQLVFRLREAVDAVVLSGDLADDGEISSLETALDFVTAKPARSDTYLTSVTKKGTLWPPKETPALLLMPGNHDRFQGRAERNPGGRIFDQIFSCYWKVGLGGVQHWEIEKRDSSLGIVAADFCLRSPEHAPHSHYGQGYAYEDTLKELERQTQELHNSQSRICVVWILHFPPLSDVRPTECLENANAVLTAARRSGVQHIISGHLHENRHDPLGDLEVFCTGSAAGLNLSWTEPTFGNPTDGNWIQMFEFDINASNTSVSVSQYQYVGSARRTFVDPKTGKSPPLVRASS